MSMKHSVVVIAGDGIGPEVVAATRQVIDVVSGGTIEWVEAQAGLATFEQTGYALPPNTIEAIQKYGVVLKGPTTTPSGGGHKSVNVKLRQVLGLSACVRPAFSIPEFSKSRPGLDLVIVREAAEGFYRCSEERADNNLVKVLSIFTADGFAGATRKAIELARTRRKKIVFVGKDNIFKEAFGLYRRVCEEIIEQEAPDIKFSYLHVDAAAMWMVRDPTQFDVILTENLFGDILSDLAAGLMGGLGVAPGACVGETCAIFEAVHGSAPDIAGKGIANPTALMLSAAMMLEHLGLKYSGEGLRAAVLAAFRHGRTADIGGAFDTQNFTKIVIHEC